MGSNPIASTIDRLIEMKYETVNFNDLPDGAFSGTIEEWNSLTPGFQREIVRSFEKYISKNVYDGIRVMDKEEAKKHVANIKKQLYNE